jgi:hypothetical protein
LIQRRLRPKSRRVPQESLPEIQNRFQIDVLQIGFAQSVFPFLYFAAQTLDPPIVSLLVDSSIEQSINQTILSLSEVLQSLSGRGQQRTGVRLSLLPDAFHDLAEQSEHALLWLNQVDERYESLLQNLLPNMD